MNVSFCFILFLRIKSLDFLNVYIFWGHVGLLEKSICCWMSYIVGSTSKSTWRLVLLLEYGFYLLWTKWFQIVQAALPHPSKMPENAAVEELNASAWNWDDTIIWSACQLSHHKYIHSGLLGTEPHTPATPVRSINWESNLKAVLL